MSPTPPESPPPSPPPAPPGPPRPSLGTIALAFTAIGLQSWGGGMSSWIRREVVTKRGWMEDRPFLAALTLCQILPGPNAVNLATMIGTVLRGGPGALAALLGMVGPPALLIVAFGAALELLKNQPALGPTMAGLGAAAIGLTFANAVQMTRSGARSPSGAALAVATAVAIGLFRLPLLLVLAVLVPVSLALAARRP